MANFIIIRYKIGMLISGFGVVWQWAKVKETNGKADVIDIDRQEALSLIEEHGLSLKLKNNDGEVWDDGTFYEKYKEGKLKI